MKEPDRHVQLSTPPATDLVSQSDYMTYARMGNVTPDISTIKSATGLIEAYTERRFIAQTHLMTYNSMPIEKKIYFPYGYLSSVTSVYVVAEDDSTTLQSSTDTYNTKTGENGYIWKRSSATWTATTRSADVMRILFVVGWATEADIPEPLRTIVRQAVMEIALLLNTNRDNYEFDILPVLKTRCSHFKKWENCI